MNYNHLLTPTASNGITDDNEAESDNCGQFGITLGKYQGILREVASERVFWYQKQADR